jgi:hypothetical protein
MSRRLQELEFELNAVVPDEGGEWSSLIRAVAGLHGVPHLHVLASVNGPAGVVARLWACGTHEGARLSLAVLEIWEAQRADVDRLEPSRTFLCFERGWPWPI